jgi:xanthine dehydrogenase YagS FAD-binding subunit
MIRFPNSPEQAAGDAGVIRAGGTDLQELRHKGIVAGDLVDLRDVSGMSGVSVTAAGGLRIGALTTCAELAANPMVQASYPALAQAAGGLATPQIRARATIGGNLLQRNRCWYFRHPDLKCLKRGGSACLARQGDHLFHSVFDLGPCAAPHASTVAMALLAQGATVGVVGQDERSVPELLGDGSDPTRDNAIEPGELISHVTLPPPNVGEHAAYFRAISRARAEWPLVEVCARIFVLDGVVIDALVALGGVAPVPLIAAKVAQELVGHRVDHIAAASASASHGAAPLPMTAYKVPLIAAAVESAFAAALDGPAVQALPAGE